MNGTAIRIPEGGAVREILPSRLANAATRYAGRCLQNTMMPLLNLSLCMLFVLH